MQKVRIEVVNNKYDENPIEVIYVGKLEEKEKSTHVTYYESVLTGMEGVQTELFIQDDLIEIVRTGNIQSKMVFKENHKDEFIYRMDVGAMSMALETDHLKVGRTRSGFDILIRYRLEIAGNPGDRNEMSIRITRS